LDGRIREGGGRHDDGVTDLGPVPAMLAGSPALRSGSVDHGAWWDQTVGGVLNIYGDLSAS
jgi:hypothetical protein